MSFIRACCLIGVILIGRWAYYRFVSTSESYYSPLSLAELRTTSADIALGNLNAQIAAERKLGEHAPLTLAQRAGMADLLALRGQILGSIADYEEAQKITEELVHDFPENGLAYLARARTFSIFHRFSDALADLQKAQSLGVGGSNLDSARASIFQATARYDEALEIRKKAREHRPSIGTLSAEASVHAERGEIEEAERLFNQAPQNFRDVSPFPIVWLYFQQGLMWMQWGNLERAREFFKNAHQRIPVYATATGHLAEVEAELGSRDVAIELLSPLAEKSDDPDYAGQLARILIEDGQVEKAKKWKEKAAQRYDELMARHPEAFADHAVEFWLAAGDDPEKALRFAQINIEVRKTPRAYELLLEAALAAKDSKLICDTLSASSKIMRPTPQFQELITQTRGACDSSQT